MCCRAAGGCTDTILSKTPDSATFMLSAASPARAPVTARQRPAADRGRFAPVPPCHEAAGLRRPPSRSPPASLEGAEGNEDTEGGGRPSRRLKVTGDCAQERARRHRGDVAAYRRVPPAAARRPTTSHDAAPGGPYRPRNTPAASRPGVPRRRAAASGRAVRMRGEMAPPSPRPAVTPGPPRGQRIGTRQQKHGNRPAGWFLTESLGVLFCHRSLAAGCPGADGGRSRSATPRGTKVLGPLLQGGH